MNNAYIGENVLKLQKKASDSIQIAKEIKHLDLCKTLGFEQTEIAEIENSPFTVPGYKLFRYLSVVHKDSNWKTEWYRMYLELREAFVKDNEQL